MISRHSTTGAGIVMLAALIGLPAVAIAQEPPRTAWGEPDMQGVWDFRVLLTEMVHTVRVIPLDGQPHLDESVEQWSGDSRGYWEGDTLVVETKNFAQKRSWRGSTGNMTLVERFRRVDDDTLEYEYTVTDLDTWKAPWSVNLPMVKNDLPLFEYACHEGNYSMPQMLGGARALERRAGGQ